MGERTIEGFTRFVKNEMEKKRIPSDKSEV
jgi:hypothetical protein